MQVHTVNTVKYLLMKYGESLVYISCEYMPEMWEYAHRKKTPPEQQMFYAKFRQKFYA